MQQGVPSSPPAGCKPPPKGSAHTLLPPAGRQGAALGSGPPLAAIICVLRRPSRLQPPQAAQPARWGPCPCAAGPLGPCHRLRACCRDAGPGWGPAHSPGGGEQHRHGGAAAATHHHLGLPKGGPTKRQKRPGQAGAAPSMLCPSTRASGGRGGGPAAASTCNRTIETIMPAGTCAVALPAAAVGVAAPAAAGQALRPSRQLQTTCGRDQAWSPADWASLRHPSPAPPPPGRPFPHPLPPAPARRPPTPSSSMHTAAAAAAASGTQQHSGGGRL